MSDRINTLSKKIVEKFDYYKLIEGDQEVYEFGLRELLWSIVHIINILIVGFLTNEVVYLLMIFSLYCPIRVYAGGYHASTRRRCYIGTILLSVFFLNTFGFLHSINITFIIILTLLLCVVIFLISPLEVSNNPLTIGEKKKYKKTVLYVLIIESILVVLLNILGVNKIIYIFATSIIGTLLTMTLGILKIKLLRTSIKLSHK